MKVGELTKLFRVINVRYIKSARKSYRYYNGIIKKGQSYYRGFGVRDSVPFEFFFTDDAIFDKRRIRMCILESEYDDYWTRRNLKEIRGE